MEKTGKLERACTLLYEAQPDWYGIIKRLKSHGFEQDEGYTLQQYAQFFSEIHLDLIVEKIKREQPELNINLDPIKEGAKSEQYVFYFNPEGRVAAYNRRGDLKGGIFQEYDKVISVDGLPVVLEIKLTEWSVSKEKKFREQDGGIRYRKGRGIRNSLMPDRYNKRLCPVRELFGHDVGLVMVIPKDIYLEVEPYAGPQSIYNWPSFGEIKGSVYGRFKDDNGIVIPLYTGRDAFRKETLKEVLKHELKLRADG